MSISKSEGHLYEHSFHPPSPSYNFMCYLQDLAGKEKSSIHITGEFDTEFQAELNKRVEIAIDELREDSDAKIKEYRDQLEATYMDQVGLGVTV